MTTPPAAVWIFTFGEDHRLTIRPEHHTTPDTGLGISLSGRFLAIRAADENSAREWFVSLFGPGRFAGIYAGTDPRWLAMEPNCAELRLTP